MPLTPEELRQLQLRRRAGGYERDSVDRVVEYMRQNYEEVWRERERLMKEVADYREVDIGLRRTLVSAQRTADELLAEAERDGRALVEQAQKKAAEVLGGIEGERDRLEAEVERLRGLAADVRGNYSDFLVAALQLLENDEVTEEPENWAFRPAQRTAEGDDDDGTGLPSEGRDEDDAGAADGEPGAGAQAAGDDNGGEPSQGPQPARDS